MIIPISAALRGPFRIETPGLAVVTCRTIEDGRRVVVLAIDWEVGPKHAGNWSRGWDGGYHLSIYDEDLDGPDLPVLVVRTDDYLPTLIEWTPHRWGGVLWVLT
jgi:hypothetical protein